MKLYIPWIFYGHYLYDHIIISSYVFYDGITRFCGSRTGKSTDFEFKIKYPLHFKCSEKHKLLPLLFLMLQSLPHACLKLEKDLPLSWFPERTTCYILTFDPAKNAILRWCTGRRGHILMAVMSGNHVSGNWLMKWDELEKIPMVHS